MGALIRRSTAALALLQLASMSCSPEAARVRDGGPGADPGNKDLVVHEQPDPRAADTTLWPGRAPAPTDRFANGEVPPATFPTPDTLPSRAMQRTFDRSPRADPRRQTDRP